MHLWLEAEKALKALKKGARPKKKSIEAVVEVYFMCLKSLAICSYNFGSNTAVMQLQRQARCRRSLQRKLLEARRHSRSSETTVNEECLGLMSLVGER